MIETMISERYARALIGLAQDQGVEAIDRFGAELEMFCKLCDATPELLPTLGERYNDLFARERIVAQIADQSGFDETVKNFLKLLVHKGRINLIAVVASEYVKLAHAAQGRLVMTVVSAQGLTDTLYQNIQELFAKKFQKTMVLQKQILPEVLGGVRVHIGDRVYDSTVSHQIDKVKQSMLESV